MKDLIWGAVGVLLVIMLAAWVALWMIPSPTQAAEAQCGIASWYGIESGRRTATGAYFDGSSMTAAMPSRSMLGSHVRVTFRGRSVVVLVNDLGPAARLHRIIDLSRAAAQRLGLPGIGRVCVERAG